MVYDFVFEYRHNGIDGSTNRGFFLSLINEALKEYKLDARAYQEPCGEWIRVHLLLMCEEQSKSVSESSLESTSKVVSESSLETSENVALESTLDSKASSNTKDQILRFAQSLAKTLPLSLEFRFINLSEEENKAYELGKNLETIIPPFAPSTHYYTPSQTSLILQAQGEHFGKLNLPHIQEEGTCLSYAASHHTSSHTPSHASPYVASCATFHAPLHTAPIEYFKDIFMRLKNGECVDFDTSRGLCRLSLKAHEVHDRKALEHLIMCDIAALKSYFRIHQAQIATLASFEKPLTYLVPKEVFASQFMPNAYGLVLVGLPFDMPLALLCAIALSEGIDYLYASYAYSQKTGQDSKIHHFAHTPLPMPKILTIPQLDATLSSNTASKSAAKAAFLRANSLIDHAKSPTLAQGCELVRERILQFQNLSHTSKALFIHLSLKEPSAFYIIEPEYTRVLLDVGFESNPALVCEMIARHYEGGGELMESFSRIHPELKKHLESHHKTPMLSHNVLDIFSTISFLLGLDSENGDMALLKSAYSYVRQRGPRIDYKLVRNKEGLGLDMTRIVRSCLSFKCADMENAILCFGVVDSLCEFVANLMRDTFINHGIKDVLLQGDLLTHSFVLDKILDYCPKEVDLYLPQSLS